MVWNLLYSAGTQHGNLHQLTVMMSGVTYFILQAHTGTGVSNSQHKKQKTKKLGRGLRENARECTGSVEISKEEIPRSKRSMYGDILAYSWL